MRLSIAAGYPSAPNIRYAFQLELNGNLPAAQALKLRSGQANRSLLIKPISMAITPTQVVKKVNRVEKPHLLTNSFQTPGDCMICMAIFGNGAVQSTMHTTRAWTCRPVTIRMTCVNASYAEVHGTMYPAASDQRYGINCCPTTTTSEWAFESPGT